MEWAEACLYCLHILLYHHQGYDNYSVVPFPFFEALDVLRTMTILEQGLDVWRNQLVKVILFVFARRDSTLAVLGNFFRLLFHLDQSISDFVKDLFGWHLTGKDGVDV
jgi:hypothetical protein